MFFFYKKIRIFWGLKMTDIISILGASIALFEVGFVIYKYSKETTRKRRRETIEIYNKIFNDTYNILDNYKIITNKTLFSSEDIRRTPEIYKEIMNHLTLLESFAKGLEYEVYDFKTFVYLTPNELFEILSSLKQFVFDERKAKCYQLLFNDFIYLTDVMSLCIQSKLQGKKIKFDYSYIKKGYNK